jgi:hypothetical protein
MEQQLSADDPNSVVDPQLSVPKIILTDPTCYSPVSLNKTVIATFNQYKLLI